MTARPNPVGDYVLCTMGDARAAGWDWIHPSAAPPSPDLFAASAAWYPAKDAVRDSNQLVIARPPKPRKVTIEMDEDYRDWWADRNAMAGTPQAAIIAACRASRDAES